MDLQQLDFDLPVPGLAHLLNAREARKAKQERVETVIRVRPVAPLPENSMKERARWN